MMKYLNLYRIILKTFGFKLRPLGTFGLLQFHRLIDGSTRALDHLLYPGFQETPIDRPVFVIGNPRGGTTFVHRSLLNTEHCVPLNCGKCCFQPLAPERPLAE